MIGGFQPIAFQTAFQQAVIAASGAGRSRRRRKYAVEIDGQEFILDSLEDVRELLGRATALAEKAAEQEALTVTKKIARKIKKTGEVPQLRLKVPEIKANVDVTEFRQKIAQVYRKAAEAAEIRLLIEMAEAEAQEEETILWLM